MAIDGARIQTLGWRQGSVFTLEASRPLIAAQRTLYGAESFEVPDDARLIVISHSCDVVNTGTQEPRIELCPAIPVARLDGRFTGTGNPRRLHVELDVGGVAVPHELLAPTRFYCPRIILETAGPDPAAALPERFRRNFLHWIAKRVRRAALPDAFNRRIDGKLRRRLAKLLAPLQAQMHALLIALDPMDEELADGEAYRMQVLALMEPEDFEDAERQRAVTATVAEMEQLLDGREDIDLEQCEVRSMTNVSLAEHRDFVIWDFDELSLEEGENPPA